MSAEPDHEEIHDNNNEPATKSFLRSELRSVETNLRTEIEGVDKRLINVESDVRDLKKDVGILKSDVDSLKTTAASILNVVQSIDRRLTEWQHIPEQVNQLREDVAELQLRR